MFSTVIEIVVSFFRLVVTGNKPGSTVPMSGNRFNPYHWFYCKRIVREQDGWRNV